MENFIFCTVKVDPEENKECWAKVNKRRVYKTNVPANIYHTNGNDKLRREDFSIHGCLDRFRRKFFFGHMYAQAIMTL